MKTAVRMAVSLVLAGSVFITGCSGWNPHEGSSAQQGTYRKTPDGYYRVKRGDSLHAIAFNFGMDWREIARWNGISAPYTIYPDQELRLVAPKNQTSGRSASTTTPGSSQTVVKAAPSRNSGSTTVDVPPKTEKTPVPVVQAPPTVAPASTFSGADPAKWLWPADGKIISNFKPNDPARKGIDIGGTEGQAVLASAGGEVVYSGSGLIGYGELVIIKHSERLLSAYAHNKKRLVSEGQNVSAGERIADMGRNDRNQAMLHFEIRLNGTPQDPLKYLPKR